MDRITKMRNLINFRKNSYSPLPLYYTWSWIGSGSGQVARSKFVAHTQPVTLSGQVFSCNSRVRSGFFLDSGENFGPPDPFTHCIVGSSFFQVGRVGFIKSVSPWSGICCIKILYVVSKYLSLLVFSFNFDHSSYSKNYWKHVKG
jgi:hypothetical protein